MECEGHDAIMMGDDGPSRSLSLSLSLSLSSLILIIILYIELVCPTQVRDTDRLPRAI